MIFNARCRCAVSVSILLDLPARLSASAETDHAVFKQMIDEMFTEGQIEQRKADIDAFNKVSTGT